MDEVASIYMVDAVGVTTVSIGIEMQDERIKKITKTIEMVGVVLFLMVVFNRKYLCQGIQLTVPNTP